MAEPAAGNSDSGVDVTLVVGATGDLGGRVVRELLAAGKSVRAVVRDPSHASGLADKGVEVVRGDLLEPESLEAALDGVSGLISTATGYTRGGKSNPGVDAQGNRNLVDAARRADVGRFVFTSVLSAEKAQSVEVFWQKKLTEDYLDEQGVPFVALRPGTLVGGAQDFWARDLRKGRLTALGDPDTPHTTVHIDDVARYLARAVDEPRALGRRIDIGMERTLASRELAAEFSKLLGREVKLRTIPWPLLSGLMRVAGVFSANIRGFRALLAFFGSGQYVADTTAQAEVFGFVPTVADSLSRYLTDKELTP